MTMPLPVNIDATSADNASDPSVKAHQQHHDTAHGVVNAAIVVVVAGTNLSTGRPAGVAGVLWRFSAGVNIGTNGSNVVNAVVGDLFFVADA